VKREPLLQRVFYITLFALLGLSLLVFLFSFKYQKSWIVYRDIYSVIIIVYTWYIMTLLFINELKNEKYPLYNEEKIAVIIPVYNEKPVLLANAISSVIKARGNKSIFVIDDGSSEGIDKHRLKRVCEQNGVQIHFFDRNQGKRHALHYAVKNMVKDHKFVVTIDSDTVLDQDALIRIVEPLNYQAIGATTGDVQLINERQNLLTRMIGSYYWIGLNIFKRAQSSLGIVVCCSGCIAGYRTDVINGIIDDFVNQRFLGEAATHSEDRHLTNLVLKGGYKVKYVPEAISHTYTPHTIKGFMRQQQRWKRGYIREATYTLSYAWKKKPILFFEILLCEITIPFLAFGLMLALLATIFINPMFFLHSILPSWILFMFVRYMPILFYGKRKIPGLFIYVLFYDILLYWQNIYALFTVKNKSWITR
jgi:hyaluronan synthase